MRQIWTIARISILENRRKQVFHVISLLMLTVIVSSTLLSIFTDGVKIKILKDLCMTSVLFGGAVLAIALGAAGIPGDIELRTIHPLMARPITRSQYLAGKFLGTFATVAAAVVFMTIVFGALLFVYTGRIDPTLPMASLFALIETGVITAVATAISTFSTPAISAVLTFMVYLCGTIKIGYFGHIISRQTSWISKSACGFVYHLLPNLECFNLKTALVHGDAIPASYLIQVGAYGVIYTAFILFVTSLFFARREV